MSSLAGRRGIVLTEIRPESPSTIPPQNIQSTELTVSSDGNVAISKDFPPVLPQDLEILDSLGHGASSNVVRCRYIKSGEIFALKRIRYTEKREIVQQIVSELHALRMLKHPNIVPLFSAVYASGHIHILMSLIDGGSLADFLKASPQVPEPALGRICWFCLRGLLFLRQNHFLHRDLKPSNILISRTGEVRIADFGMARQLRESMEQAESFLGTMCYMSPERLEGEAYGFKSDIWSLGLILYQCVLGRFPISDDPKKVKFWDIVYEVKGMMEIKVPAGYSDGVRDFISRCLKVNPEERDGVEQLVAHPWALQFQGEDADAALLRWITDAQAKREEDAKQLNVSLKSLGIKKDA